MFANFLLCLHSQTLRSDGRVARQWSAKPSTPVRIRFRPQKRRIKAIFLE